jgi:UDP-N-acetylmuramoyl-tripeptide--D-alanyl-D-alanine ligase
VTAVRLTLGWVAEVTGGTLRGGDREHELGNVVTDSRVVQPGDLFIALRGPRFDAHDFVDEVLAKGAAAVVGRAFPGRQGAPGHAAPPGHPDARRELSGDRRGGPAGRRGAAVIEVDDTLKALQQMAHAVRTEAATRVIAITGSAGKTTTKETIAAFLEERFAVVKNKGNLNNHIGLPLSLMQLRERPDVAVVELGMNHAGEISTLVAIAEPDVRVWTNVGDAHLGFFDSPDAIADAKAEIVEGATPDSLLVCNADDARVMARVTAFPGRTVTFGTSADADVRATDVEDRGLDGMRARIVARGHGEQALETPLLGRGNLSNVLAATAVALEAGVALADIAAVAARLTPADRRGAVRRLRHGIVLIDDSYNSSPAALQRALEVVAREARPGRKVAILGEMLELGEHATRLHAESGAVAAASGLGLLLTVGGGPAKEMAAAAIAAGLPSAAVSYFETSDAAATAAARLVRDGDVVLVKGSRGVRTDLVVDRLTAEFA